MSSTITLEVELHCMCLLVPDPEKGAVHVLMPNTHCGSRMNHHIAILRYTGADKQVHDRHLEGWALSLGDPESKNTTLTLAPPPGLKVEAPGLVDGTVVELASRDRTPLRVPRKLLDQADPLVVSRITFHGGSVVAAKSQANQWSFNGVDNLAIATQVTWQMEIEPGQMAWTKLDPNKHREPLPSLDATATGTNSLQLKVFHVTPRTLPRKSGPEMNLAVPDFSHSVLVPPEVRAHFGMFYKMLGLNDPRLQVLPYVPQHPAEKREIVPSDDDPSGSPGWACLNAWAKVED